MTMLSCATGEPKALDQVATATCTNAHGGQPVWDIFRSLKPESMYGPSPRARAAASIAANVSGLTCASWLSAGRNAPGSAGGLAVTIAEPVAVVITIARLQPSNIFFNMVQLV